MKRAPELIVLFACVAGATMMMAGSGIGAELGGTPATGGEEQVKDLEDMVQDAESDQRGVDSIIGLAITSVSLVFSMIPILLFAPIALQNLGFPAWIAVPISLPIYALLALFIVEVLRAVNVL